ncbi:MAG: tyrosine-protein phosphatase [Gammaproteobacteria bacterium]|nr:tyrosine-protein phosphatase [Gammaproteobacteria bacterium]
MITRQRLPITLFTLLILSFTSHGIAEDKPAFDTHTVIASQIFNLRQQSATHFSGGQPSQAQLKTLSEAGVKHIVNLRMPEELKWNERQWVQSLGMQYHTLPIAGVDSITAANATALADLLAKMGDEPVLIHCASSNRLGALIAMDEAINKDQSLEQAIITGKRWGMTRLEPIVRAKLSKN